MTPTPADMLARLTDGGRYRHRSAAYETFKPPRLDSGVTLELPGFATLAEAYIVPMLRERFDVYRRGAAILTRPAGTDAEPQPLNQLALAQQLVEQFAALPPREDAGRPYKDLRLFATESLPGTRADYIGAAIRTARGQLPAWRPPVERIERGPAKTPAERKAAQRARDRALEEASARAWLTGYLTGWDDEDEAPVAGSRVEAAELCADAIETIADYDADEPIDEDDPDGPVYVIPSARTFYRVADELLGARRRRNDGSRFYVIPAPPAQPKENNMDTIAEAVLERVTQQLTEETLAEFGPSILQQIRAQLMAGKPASALTLQREHLAATGTDGAVVDLADARARRR